MTKIYSITFNKGGKKYNFKSEAEIEINTNVIVETEKGEQLGTVVEIIKMEPKNSSIKDILRIADKKDIDQFTSNLSDALSALENCKKIANDLNLKMNFTSASYTFSRNQLMFNFYADERVDFRELAKKLASIYRTRIELRQIGARDKAREVGGYGVCGQKLCCSRFLNQMESVSINQAKNQCLALNPNKINGSCKRLLCCLAYEDETYSENRTKMPNYGEKIKIDKKEGTVKSLDILNMKYKLDINGERIEVKVDENSKK